MMNWACFEINSILNKKTKTFENIGLIFRHHINIITTLLLDNIHSILYIFKMFGLVPICFDKYLWLFEMQSIDLCCLDRDPKF